MNKTKIKSPQFDLEVGGTAIWVIWVAVLFILWNLGGGFAVPSPMEVWEAWTDLLQNGLLNELWVSFRLNLEAICLSLVMSIGLAFLTSGSITGRASWVDKFITAPISAMTKFRFFGMAGFVIIFTRVFGGGHGLKVALLVFGVSVFFLTSMMDVVGSATKEKFDLTRSIRMGKLRGILEVVVLGKMDQTFDALRQNAAIGWMMLTMVEGLVRFEGGVGVIMLNESKYRNLGAVFAVQLTILLIGIIQDQFIGWLKNICCPHAKLSLEKR